MSGMLRMQLESLRSASKKMGNAGEDLQRVLEELRSSLDAEGPCWGSDEAGQSFAQNYVPNSEKLLGALGKTSEALGDIGVNLGSTADDTEATDQRAGEDIADVPRRV